MRVEPFTVGDFIHAYNRGNRKMIVFRDINDRWRFLKILRFFNDQNPRSNFSQTIEVKPRLRWSEWPEGWPAQQPLVKILSYCLKDNHIHLLLKEIIAGGISQFMKKINNGFTGYINIKYDEVGQVFQGSYKGRTAPSEGMLDYMDAYIQVFNPFEDLSGGINRAWEDFDWAFEEAMRNPFCSLGESFGKRNLKIIDRDILAERFPSLEVYKEFCRDAILVRQIREVLGKLIIE